MSTEFQQSAVEALAERVERLEKHILNHCERFNDVQDDHTSLSERLNEYQQRLDKQLSYANSVLIADLNKLLDKTNSVLSAEFRDKFDTLLAAFRENIQQEIASGRVLVTRPATREEIKSGVGIAVRQASPAELRK
jgi:predicted nuclease with TOPRIM domain